MTKTLHRPAGNQRFPRPRPLACAALAVVLLTALSPAGWWPPAGSASTVWADGPASATVAPISVILAPNATFFAASPTNIRVVNVSSRRIRITITPLRRGLFAVAIVTVSPSSRDVASSSIQLVVQSGQQIMVANSLRGGIVATVTRIGTP